MGCAFGSAGGTETTTTDSLYEAALSSVGQASIEESIKAFEQVIRADRQYAPAYAELARLLMMRNRTRDRLQANKLIQQAIRLEPDQLEYPLMLGDLLYRQGFWFNAEQQYEKVFARFPDNASVISGIGYRAMKHFFHYQEMRGEGGILFREYAREEKERAVAYFNKSIDADPDFKDAYYHLGLVYLEDQQPASLIRVSMQLLQRDSLDMNAMLFCGLGYHAMGKHERANAFYEEALKRMDDAERAVMESVDLLADGGLSSNEAIEEFWHRQNPLYLTPFNERRMEHYRRVAYVNLRFGKPSKGIVGSRTDMGRTYIKFGKPQHRRADRPGIRTLIPIDRIRPNAARAAYENELLANVDPHLESWYYEGFALDFINWDGLDDWKFSPTRIGGFGWRQELDAKFGAEKYPHAREVLQNNSPRFTDPYRNQKYTLPHLIAAFQEEDRMRVEIAYAIPETRLKKAPESQTIHLDDGIFVFDRDGREQARQILPRTDLMRLGENTEFLLSSYTLHIAPGDYNLVVEVGDRVGGSIGTFREGRTFAPPDSTLAMSDLLLASRIEMKTAYPESRNDLHITPNPLRTFRRSQALFLYLELYNLTQDVFGQTRYDIAYRISPLHPSQVDPSLIESRSLIEGPYVLEVQQTHPDSIAPYQVQYRLTRRDRASQQMTQVIQETPDVETTVTSQYEGASPRDFTFLEIDTGAIPAGVYKLIVTLQDMRTRQRVEREVIFRVL